MSNATAVSLQQANFQQLEGTTKTRNKKRYKYGDEIFNNHKRPL